MEQQRKPVAGDLYCHFKGNLYEIITVATHSETEEEMVVYRQKYGEYRDFVRPLSMFLSEVDHEKYPEVKQKYRFELVTTGAGTTKKPETLEEPVVDTVIEKCDNVKTASEGILYEFLDAPTLKEKLKLLEDCKEVPSDLIITNMAISIDVVIEDGTPEARMEELIDCLRTMAHFECTRLR